MASHEIIEKANKLKEEGNALYIKQEYALASTKYTKAIALDNKNAILYANRAACRLALRQFLNACTDATKATKLDPLYSKAHARMATAHDALRNFTLSVDAWHRALDTLPKENLAPTELKQKEQYEAGLKATWATISEFQCSVGTGIPFKSDQEKMPWVLAAELLPPLIERSEADSSAWIIHGAYKEFSKGVDVMQDLYKKMRSGADTTFDSSTHDGIDCLVNGILRDPRVLFHVNELAWTAMYNTEVEGEMIMCSVWADAAPENIIGLMQLLGGWDAAGELIRTTVSSWIMRGVIDGRLAGKHGKTVEFLGKAIEVLKWGIAALKDVSREDRGPLFQEAALFGLRSMYLDSFMMAYKGDPGLNSKYPLEDLYEGAKDLLEAIINYKPATVESVDPGFIQSFIIYPCAHATAMQGFYHSHMAKLNKSDEAATKDHHMKAANLYIQAAVQYPDDDEYYAWFVGCTLMNLWASGARVRDQLEVLERLRLSIPKMQRIWANSAMANQGRDRIFERMLIDEKAVLEMVEMDKLKLSDCTVMKSLSLNSEGVYVWA